VHIVASSWYFTLFHDKDARSNNPQISVVQLSWIQAAYGRLPKISTTGTKVVQNYQIFWAIIRNFHFPHQCQGYVPFSMPLPPQAPSVIFHLITAIKMATNTASTS